MMDKELILLEEYCMHCGVDNSFINYLNELGLIDIIESEHQLFIKDEQLNDLEKFVEWHYDLDISPAGIDAIQHLLLRMNDMQQEISMLKKKLSMFE